MPLTRLVQHVQKVAERWRSKKSKMDFRCKMGKPLHVARDIGILKQAAQVYTIKMFDEFKKEFYDIHLVVKEFEISNNYYVYVIHQETHTSHFIIHFNPLSFDVYCSCKKYESMGILCCHSLKVFNLNGVNFIPSSYILRRWTKDVKRGIRMEDGTELADKDKKSSVTLMRNKLMIKAYKLINHSALDSKGIDIAERHLSSWMQEIECHVANMNIGPDHSSSNFDDTDDECEDPYESQEIQVKNPKNKTPVGESNKRIKRALEKKKKGTQAKRSATTLGKLFEHIMELLYSCWLHKGCSSLRLFGSDV
ncbi:unnamed protein product [Amaranthus hypochondriacus]